MKIRFSLAGAILALACTLPATVHAQSIRRDEAFNTEEVPRNDDGSSASTPLGFTLNFFGRERSSCYVNNNGNITFDAALATYTPFGLNAAAREIIAPFFADVDTRGEASNLVRYGRTTINGRPAFGVNYINVGYFSTHTDKLNSFQVVLIERSDTGAGNFDIEFNYEKIQWETGDASGGAGGYGGNPVTIGWSNGSGEPGTSFELEGSGQSLVFLDNGRRALIRQKLSSDVFGRLLFRARGGRILPQLTILTGNSLGTGVVGRPYSTTLQSDGGSAPYTWTLTPDTVMAPGLSLNSATGVISGTPSATGTFSFTLGLTARTEDGNVTTSKRSSITIQPPTLSITTSVLRDAQLNAPYSQTLTAAGATSALAWTLDDTSALPPGLSLSRQGVLTGFPQREGVYTFTVRAASTAADGSLPAERFLKIVVAPSTVPVTASCSLQPATAGVPYTQLLSAQGGSGPYTYRLLGQLPVGLILDSRTGAITGTAASPGDYRFQLEVRDARAQTTTSSCSFAVYEPELLLAGCPLPATGVGTPIAHSLTAQGGEGPYTWSVIGTLPRGLTLDSYGTLSGTPAQSGGYLFRVLAVDSQGRQTSGACGLTVLPTPLSTSFCVLPETTSGTPYTQTLRASGGEAPYFWRVSSGSLPDGLTLSAAGVANGTPAAPGTYQFTASVTDAKGYTVTQQCSLSVRPQPMVLSTACPLPEANLGTAYATKLGVTGGAAPYRFTVSGGLPEGLSLSSDGAITGTPQRTGGRGFQVELRDAQGNATRQACSLDVTLPAAPQVRVTGVPTTATAADPSLAPVIELSRSYPFAIRGTLSIEAQPETNSISAEANTADPRVRFLNGFQTTTFTVPAGSRTLRIPVATTGTVAGNLVFRAANLQTEGNELPTVVIPAVTRIAPSAPSLTAACYVRTSTGQYEMQITGVSNTRELDFGYVVVDGKLQQTDLAGYSGDFFATPASIRAGGAFQFTFPFTLANASSSLRVAVRNTAGMSAARDAAACR
ncbi:hypothetical protein F183_A42090 [Bryobacterales bacterium F-183]|nr:hypothetical protein F183_A42090 [Bryobacterales bacterium F-183]